MSKKYTCVVIDPPYFFGDSLKMSDVKRGAQANYGTMSISDIKQLPVKDLCDPSGAVLCLWVPSSLLKEGIEIMEAYGFTLKQTYIWNKTIKDPFKVFKSIYKHFKKIGWHWTISGTLVKKCLDNFSLQNILSFGMGRLFRNCHEICLIGTNNNKIYKKLQNRSQRSVSFSPNLGHSTKPEHLQDSLELMFPGQNYLEIFGRRLRNNWDVIGNESATTMGQDIRVSLNKLLE
jgi:N6-adenosine-specific RNA methylase IME4